MVTIAEKGNVETITEHVENKSLISIFEIIYAMTNAIQHKAAQTSYSFKVYS